MIKMISYKVSSHREQKKLFEDDDEATKEEE